MHIKTHLDNTLYLSSVWSDLSCAAELVIAGAPAGFTLQPCTNREERARESADCRMIFIYLIFSQTILLDCNPTYSQEYNKLTFLSIGHYNRSTDIPDLIQHLQYSYYQQYYIRCRIFNTMIWDMINILKTYIDRLWRNNDKGSI